LSHQRLVPFEGPLNFRDLGGYACAGGRTRWGVLYRADGLQDMTVGDVARYNSLGIGIAYDLRRDSERELRPDPVPNVQLCVTSPILDAGIEPIDRGSVAGPRGGEQLLRTMYANMLTYSASMFGTLLTMIVDDGRPAVFHCHGGKDRTGLAAALILELVGVDRKTVLDDYELTAKYRLREHQDESFDSLVASGLAPEAAAAVLGTPRWAMVDTLADLDADYGGAAAYLAGPGAVHPDALARFAELLVGP
jgi:protein-tyrosine phosphatase